MEGRIHAARLAQRVRTDAETAERDALADMKRTASSRQLDEQHRRRIWMGYSRLAIHSSRPEIVNRAKLGRDWLRAIGQEPDWRLILDKKGRVVGRRDTPIDPDAPNLR
jgi:hypothetical protein